MATDHVLQRAGGEEVLLLETKLLAVDIFVVGVEDLGDIFGEDFGSDGTLVVAAVEATEVEGLGGLGLPERKVLAMPERYPRMGVS